MSMLFASEGERFFVYNPRNPSEILLVVKVLKIESMGDYAMDLELFMGTQSEIYYAHKSRQDRKIALPFRCYIGVGSRKGLPALMIEADHAYNIARERLYISTHGNSCTLKNNPNENPLELRYNQLRRDSLEKRMHSKVPLFGEISLTIET